MLEKIKYKDLPRTKEFKKIFSFNKKEYTVGDVVKIDYVSINTFGFTADDDQFEVKSKTGMIKEMRNGSYRYEDYFVLDCGEKFKSEEVHISVNEVVRIEKVKQSTVFREQEKQNIKISLDKPIEMSIFVDSETGRLSEDIDAIELFKIFSEKMIVSID